MPLELDNLPVLPADEQERLGRDFQATGSQESRNRLVECHLRLVLHFARRYTGFGLSLDDLIQEGTVGLIRAVEKFDWDRGTAFSTYAAFWIRRCIQMALHKDHLIPVTEDAASKGFRPPEVLSLGRDESADDRLPRDVEDPSAGEQANLDSTSQRAVREAVRNLPPRHRELIELRFGIHDGEPKALTRCARQMRIAFVTARRLEDEALEKLRESSPFLQVTA